MSIDPNSDDEIYEINVLEDSLETVIKLTREKVLEESATGEETSKKPTTGEATMEATEATAKAKDQPSTTTSTSATDDRVLVPDVISQTMEDDYMKEEELEEETSDAETFL